MLRINHQSTILQFKKVFTATKKLMAHKISLGILDMHDKHSLTIVKCCKHIAHLSHVRSYISAVFFFTDKISRPGEAHVKFSRTAFNFPVVYFSTKIARFAKRKRRGHYQASHACENLHAEVEIAEGRDAFNVWQMDWILFEIVIRWQVNTSTLCDHSTMTSSRTLADRYHVT